MTFLISYWFYSVYLIFNFFYVNHVLAAEDFLNFNHIDYDVFSWIRKLN